MYRNDKTVVITKSDLEKACDYPDPVHYLGLELARIVNEITQEEMEKIILSSIYEDKNNFDVKVIYRSKDNE